MSSGTSTPTSIHTPTHSMLVSSSTSGTTGVKRKVLIIGTGGTIASEPTANGYSPLRNDSFYRRIRQHPQLTDPFYTNYPKPAIGTQDGHAQGSGGAGLTGVSTTSFGSEVHTTQVGVNTLYEELVTPPLDDRGIRVGYEILDLDKHMDSSEMTPAGELSLVQYPTSPGYLITQPISAFSAILPTSKVTDSPEWNTIASLVSDNWDLYEGFIILSGTDTLAYTASILTFLFTHPGKPILITGAQIPLSQPRSDGWTNLLDSLYVAGVLNFAGVGVVFHHTVLQGCRATKASANLFNAFQTPCVAPLINLNVKISTSQTCTSIMMVLVCTLAQNMPLPARSSTLPPRLIQLITTPTVISAAIYPGITGTILSAQIEAVPTCRAVILSAYGSGNLPINEESGVIDALKRAVEREILVVVISQCGSAFAFILYTPNSRLWTLDSSLQISCQCRPLPIAHGQGSPVIRDVCGKADNGRLHTQRVPPLHPRTSSPLRRRVTRVRPHARSGIRKATMARQSQRFDVQTETRTV